VDETRTPLSDARRHRRGLRDAMDDLERALAAPAGTGARWVKDFAGAVEAVGGALAAHVATTESDDGLFADILGRTGSASAVDRLKRDHVDLVHRADALRDVVAHAPATPDIDWIDHQRSAAMELLAVLARHRQRGADLVYEVYTVDIGGED
jgi:hypothetical protein